MADLIRALGAGPGGFVPRGAPRPVVTEEGEYAVRVDLEGVIDSGSVYRSIGMVFVDDFYALVDGETRSSLSELSAVVDHLVATDAHLLGVRRRRYVYAPPRGWHGFLAGPYHAHWLPLDHPRDPSTIVVPPAIPRRDRLDPVTVVASIGGAETFVGVEPVAMSTARLSGWSYGAASPEHDRICTVVVLEDHRYMYPVVARSSVATRDATASTLDALVRSIDPLPADRTAPRPGGALTHWSD